MRAIPLDLDDTLGRDHSDFLAAVDATAGMSAAGRTRAQQRWREAAAETTLPMTDISSDEIGLARQLAESYRERRLARCAPYPEVVGVLDDLRGFARLGVVTNGMEEHQRAKLDFALERLGAHAADAVMVGDNPARDIAGAQQAGIRGVSVDRNGGDDCGVFPDARVSDLGGVAALGWW